MSQPRLHLFKSDVMWRVLRGNSPVSLLFSNCNACHNSHVPIKYRFRAKREKSPKLTCAKNTNRFPPKFIVPVQYILPKTYLNSIEISRTGYCSRRNG